MSLLEGHGDVTMDRAGAAAVPGAERFSRVLRERRQQVRGPAKLLQQVLGLEAKLRQYAEGEDFVRRRREGRRARALQPGVARARVAALPGRDPEPGALGRPGRSRPRPPG